MKIAYTTLNLDKPDPVANVSKEWVPMVNVRVGIHHQKTPRFPAVVDSGSGVCMFRTDVADFLNIDFHKNNVGIGEIGGIIQGPKQAIYYCPVQLYVAENWVISVTAGFLKKLPVAGILGRTGFFDAFDISFDHKAKPHEFTIERVSRPN